MRDVSLLPENPHSRGGSRPPAAVRSSSPAMPQRLLQAGGIQPHVMPHVMPGDVDRPDTGERLVRRGVPAGPLLLNWVVISGGARRGRAVVLDRSWAVLGGLGRSLRGSMHP